MGLLFTKKRAKLSSICSTKLNIIVHDLPEIEVNIQSMSAENQTQFYMLYNLIVRHGNDTKSFQNQHEHITVDDNKANI